MQDEIHADGLPTPRRYFAMLAIAIGITMAVLDGTVVNVALPSIARELGAAPSAAVWIVNAYQLVIVATAAAAGRPRRADRLPPGLPGRHRRLHPRLARLRALVQPRELVAARVLQGSAARRS